MAPENISLTGTCSWINSIQPPLAPGQLLFSSEERLSPVVSIAYALERGIDEAGGGPKEPMTSPAGGR
jgi:hypothetical protein